MAGLIDTSILVRLANSADAAHVVAARAVVELHRRGEIIHSTAQVFVEFRNVATRPTEVNGLGLDLATVDALTATYETYFPLLEESPAIYTAWKLLVQAAGVSGKQVHDARLAAICHVHGLANLVTFNVGHFSRLAGVAPGFTVIDPRSV